MISKRMALAGATALALPALAFGADAARADTVAGDATSITALAANADGTLTATVTYHCAPTSSYDKVEVTTEQTQGIPPVRDDGYGSLASPTCDGTNHTAPVTVAANDAAGGDQLSGGVIHATSTFDSPTGGDVGLPGDATDEATFLVLGGAAGSSGHSPDESTQTTITKVTHNSDGTLTAQGTYLCTTDESADDIYVTAMQDQTLHDNRVDGFGHTGKAPTCDGASHSFAVIVTANDINKTFTAGTVNTTSTFTVNDPASGCHRPGYPVPPHSSCPAARDSRSTTVG